MAKTLKTNFDWAALLLRLFLALVLFPHGAQKLLGWFGGFGFEGSMQYFTGQVGLPWVIGFLVIVIEFFGPLALALGIAVRFSAASIAVVMIGIITTTFHDHFFMDWFGIQHTEGMEFFLLAIGIALGLVFTGAGVYSIGHLLSDEPTVSR